MVPRTGQVWDVGSNGLNLSHELIPHSGIVLKGKISSLERKVPPLKLSKHYNPSLIYQHSIINIQSKYIPLQLCEQTISTHPTPTLTQSTTSHCETVKVQLSSVIKGTIPHCRIQYNSCHIIKNRENRGKQTNLSLPTQPPSPKKGKEIGAL